MSDFGLFNWTRFDISRVQCLRLDLRPMFCGGQDDTSAILPAGTRQLSVHGEVDEATGLYVGEILTSVQGRDVTLVGSTTGVPGEVTPDMILACGRDAAYAESIAGWLGVNFAA